MTKSCITAAKALHVIKHHRTTVVFLQILPEKVP